VAGDEGPGRQHPPNWRPTTRRLWPAVQGHSGKGVGAKKTTSVGCLAGGQRRVLQAEGGAGDVVGKGRPAAGQAERQAASRGH